MLKLSIMTEQELTQIFGTLDSLIPLHEGWFSSADLFEVFFYDGFSDSAVAVPLALNLFCTFSPLRSVESPPRRQETGRIHGTRRPHLD